MLFRMRNGQRRGDGYGFGDGNQFGFGGGNGGGHGEDNRKSYVLTMAWSTNVEILLEQFKIQY